MRCGNTASEERPRGQYFYAGKQVISWHPNTIAIGNGKAFAKGWLSANVSEPERIAECIARFAWSPCTFKDGHRREQNFLAADLIALDFDDGATSLSEAVRIFCDSMHVVGTTRNHRKNKGGIIADRFRVVLWLEQVVTDLATYRASVAHYVRQYDTDPAAVDGARLFWPCSEIVSICSEGYRQEVVAAPPAPQRKRAERYARDGAIRPRTLGMLRTVVAVGERNRFCFQAAKDLCDAGYTAEEIYDLIIDSETYRGTVAPDVGAEIERCIASGIKSVETGKAYGKTE